MNTPLITPSSPTVPMAPVRLRTGLLFLGVSVVTVALLGWGVARATARVAGLEGAHLRADTHLARVERILGGPPTTVAGITPVAPSHNVAEGE